VPLQHTNFATCHLKLPKAEPIAQSLGVELAVFSALARDATVQHPAAKV